jgi:hypothetical protein
MLTTIAALWFNQETVDQAPSILVAIPSSLDLSVPPSFKEIDFLSKKRVYVWVPAGPSLSAGLSPT